MNKKQILDKYVDVLPYQVTARELRAIVEIRNIYNSWHACALTRKEAVIMGVPEGQLCDTCEGCIKAHIQNIFLTHRVRAI